MFQAGKTIMDHTGPSMRRAIVFAPFFSAESSASRPRRVASVLADFMPVDVVTSDFDHTLKIKRNERQHAPFAKMIYIGVPPYQSNVCAARLVSHLVFSFKAAGYFLLNRGKYGVVYLTAPLNVLAWLVLSLAGTRIKIVDVVDIWPDVLPFSARARRLLAPAFAAWRWFLNSSVGKCDLVMAVSDRFLDEVSRSASHHAQLKRFYIGCRGLRSATPKNSVFTIAYVGNLGHVYDFDTLVDALSEDGLRNRVQLFVIGKGDRQRWLLGELEARGIRHTFFGPVYDQERLAEILGRCHAGFNGFRDTTAAFSYKASTYFAAGLPIVNSMEGDLRSLVENYGLGENYQSENREQLRSCIYRLLENGVTAKAAKCREFFAAQLEEDKICTDIRDFLRAAFAELRPELTPKA